MFIGHNHNSLVNNSQHVSLFISEFAMQEGINQTISMKDIQKNVIAGMKRLGFKTAQELADASGVSQPTIFRIVSGKGKGVKDASIKRLAVALNVTEAELRGLQVGSVSKEAFVGSLPISDDQKRRLSSMIELYLEECGQKSPAQPSPKSCKLTDNRSVKHHHQKPTH